MTNIGSVDRWVRFVAGLLLIILSFVPPNAPLIAAPGVWKWVIVAAGVILIVTAAIRFCPAYGLLGLSTGSRR